MYEIIIAVITGLFVGALFSALKLPLPAPPVMSGIMGIVGIYLGGKGYGIIVERFFS